MDDLIKIRGARQHNLKNVDLDIPRGKMVVFTGLSGSGKSSLAFDTIYAEGQRRYVESLSSYARQFLGVMTKPDVDRIEGLSPAISIDQKTTSHNPRSTVGTITEIYDYMRLLYARIGHPTCPDCGTEIAPQSAQQIVNQVIEKIGEKLGEDREVRLMILSPVVQEKKGTFEGLFRNLLRQGYIRARVDGQVVKLDSDIALLKNNKHTIEAVMDRMSWTRDQEKDEVAKANLKSRLTQAIEQGLKLSDGLVEVGFILDTGFDIPENPQELEQHLFSEKYACPNCNMSLPDLEPRTFSFNSPQGACEVCTGLGTQLKVNDELIVAPNLTLVEGGILPYATMFENETWFSRLVATVCEENEISIREPLKNLSEEQIQILFYGTGNRTYRVKGINRQGNPTVITETFAGFIPELEKRYQETESEWVRGEIEKYMRMVVCPACEGKRLKPEALAVFVGGFSIADVSSWPIGETLGWAKGLDPDLNTREKQIATPIVNEVRARLEFLISVGLDYLTLDRTASTLAGGEAQRIRLASQIGSGLTGVLYVLDEPSIGLHPRDTHRLIASLQYLRDLGNTIVVVEHDEDTMKSSDYLVDFGPAAGKHGGAIIAQGTPEEIMKDENSVTGKYLSGAKKIKVNRKKLERKHAEESGITDMKEDTRSFSLLGATEHNLKNVDVEIPMGKFVCVTGVSGSGKSTLIVDTLYHALAQHLNPHHRELPGAFRELEGADEIDKVLMIDQSPIGRTPRSNPATYTGIFTPIRQLFAQSTEGRLRGYTPGRFSFNVKGGRCEACEGGGEIKIEMQFMADIYVTCEVCGGKRYNDETLQVEYRGKNISEVLHLTVDEGVEFFHAVPGIRTKLETLQEVGLGYVELGQPAPTLSGGEAQRIKLATELSKRTSGNTVYILDEPTTGLHYADLQKLLNVLHALVVKGNTVVVIEHNLDLIRSADWVIDLGPEGGNGGGMILGAGTPKDIMNLEGSHTGEWLSK